MKIVRSPLRLSQKAFDASKLLHGMTPQITSSDAFDQFTRMRISAPIALELRKTAKTTAKEPPIMFVKKKHVKANESAGTIHRATPDLYNQSKELMTDSFQKQRYTKPQ
jgi:hypothetical protein